MATLLRLNTRLIVLANAQPSFEVEITTEAGIFRMALPRYKPFTLATIENFREIIKSQVAPIVLD